MSSQIPLSLPHLQWQQELRLLKEDQTDQSMRQSGPFLQSGASLIRWTSKVSLYPSPSFLSKNQLAKKGPDSVAPVVIPALAPTLDKSLKSDRSHCPVRALRYYLNRTSDIKQNKEVVCLPQKRFRQRHLTRHNLLMD